MADDTKQTEALATQDAEVDIMVLGDDLQGTMERPQGVDGRDFAGKEDISPDEVRLPRLSIAQGLSKQIIPGESNYIDGLKLFQMFNDVTSEIYGNGPLTVVPVKRSVTRIQFDPNDKKVPLDRDVPAGDPRTKWTTDPTSGKGIPPAATEYVEFICLLLRPGRAPEPIVVSIKTTNKFMRRTAELWTTYVMMRNGPIYSGLYKISSGSEKGKNKEGQDTQFGVFTIKNAGYVPTATPAGRALITYAREMHEALKNQVIDVQREPGDDDSFDPATLEAQAPNRGGM